AQEAIAGVYRPAFGASGNVQDPAGIQVRRRPVAIQREGPLHRKAVARVGIVGRIEAYRLDAQLGRGARDAYGDLAAIGDQQAAGKACGGAHSDLILARRITSATRAVSFWIWLWNSAGLDATTAP